MSNWLKMSQVSVQEVLMQIVRGNINASQAKMQLSMFDIQTVCQEIGALWTTHQVRSLQELSDLIGCNKQPTQPLPNGVNNANNQPNPQNQTQQEDTTLTP